MKIKIYQINLDRDKGRVGFLSLSETRKFQGSDQINSKIYDLVYSGDVPYDSLERVYEMFNVDHPTDYTGRSLSCSDVVQVMDGGKVSDGFYFCDRIGFAQVEFDPAQTLDALPRCIDVVLVEPGKLARPARIADSLEMMRHIVRGNIDAIHPFEEQVCIVSNVASKNSGLPLNRAVYTYEDHQVDMTYGELAAKFRAQERSGTGQHMLGYIVFTEDSFLEPYTEEQRTYVVSSDNKAFKPNMGGYSIYASSLDGVDKMVRLEAYMAAEHGGKNGWKVERCYTEVQTREMFDIIAGTFFICDCSGENFGSLSEDQLKKYTELFKQPEHFLRINGEIAAIPYTPKKSQER